MGSGWVASVVGEGGVGVGGVWGRGEGVGVVRGGGSLLESTPG